MCFDDPLWVQAWATVLLFVAAVVAGVVAVRAYRIERRRDERYEQERRASQASLIAAWPGHISSGFILHNASSLPVYDVEIVPVFVSEHESEALHVDHETIHALPPGKKTILYPQEVTERSVGSVRAAVGRYGRNWASRTLPGIGGCAARTDCSLRIGLQSHYVTDPVRVIAIPQRRDAYRS